MLTHMILTETHMLAWQFLPGTSFPVLPPVSTFGVDWQRSLFPRLRFVSLTSFE